MKNYEGYIKHLESQVSYWQKMAETERKKNVNTNVSHMKHLESQKEYWQAIALEEKKKNMKLENILKKLEEKIYGIKEDK